jgi:hypothetical protein
MINSLKINRTLSGAMRHQREAQAQPGREPSARQPQRTGRGTVAITQFHSDNGTP